MSNKKWLLGVSLALVTAPVWCKWLLELWWFTFLVSTVSLGVVLQTLRGWGVL